MVGLANIQIFLISKLYIMLYPPTYIFLYSNKQNLNQRAMFVSKKCPQNIFELYGMVTIFYRGKM